MKEASAVMVTGGAGFVGRQVVRNLTELGRTVVAIYHHRLPEVMEHVYPVCVDIKSSELLAAPLRGVDTVVHLAWVGGLSGYEQVEPGAPIPGAPSTPNLQMLAQLLRAMEKAGTKRLVFVSAIGADRWAKAPFLREKYLAESMILNSAVAEKIIVRSAVVWSGQGAKDPFLGTILRLMRFPIYPIPSRPKSIEPIHVRDLATLITNICAQPSSTGVKIFAAKGADLVSVAELFKLVGDALIKKPRLAVGGLLGRYILPWLERDPGQRVRPKIEQFLAIGEATAGCEKGGGIKGGPAPVKQFSIREKLLD